MALADAQPPQALPPGAQPERTALAWQRTIVVTVLGATLHTMTALRSGQLVLAALGGVLVVVAVVALVVFSPARALRAGGHSAVWPDLVRLVVAVVALGALGIAMAVVTVVG